MLFESGERDNHVRLDGLQYQPSLHIRSFNKYRWSTSHVLGAPLGPEDEAVSDTTQTRSPPLWGLQPPCCNMSQFTVPLQWRHEPNVPGVLLGEEPDSG